MKIINKNQRIFKEVLLKYETDRMTAKKIEQKRLNEIYEKINRIQEIDINIAEFATKLSKLIIHNSGNKEKHLENLKKELNKLNEEKINLLVEYGYQKNYLDPIYFCEKCKDTAYVDSKKCSCFKQRIVDKYYEVFHLGDMLLNENFENFDLNFYSDKINKKYNISPRYNMRATLDNVLNFIEVFEYDKKNMLFTGATGLGKTFLCNCVAKEILDKGYSVLYLTAPKFFNMLEQHKFNKDVTLEDREQLELLKDVDLLIIDDLGTEMITQFTQTETFNIINNRILEKRPTIISTNFKIGEIKERYTDRIASRIIGNYEIHEFFGEDIRIKKEFGV